MNRDSKRIFGWIIAIALPLAAYLALFYVFDPHGYYKGDPNDKSLTGLMLDYKNNDYDAIVIGDSRVDGIDMDGISAKSGYRFKNMAYGGSMSTEMASLFEWGKETDQDIKAVVVATGFYNMNTALQQDRVEAAKKLIDNPFNYAFSIDNAKDMFKGIIEKYSIKASEIDDDQKKANFETHLNSMSYYLDNYKLDEEALKGIIEIGKYCEDSGIRFVLVLPPWWKEFYSELETREITEQFELYKEELKKCDFKILDFESPDCELSNNYDDFSDYAHFHGETQELFWNSVIEEICK